MTAWANEWEEVGIEGSGSGKKLENIKIKLFGELEQLYDVNYRTHSFLVDREKWVKNGEKTGFSRIEMIQISKIRISRAIIIFIYIYYN